MTARRFRIRDLLRGRTLCQSGRGRDIVAYWDENFRPGYCDWLIEYDSGRRIWKPVPNRVLKAWRSKAVAS